jgi:hypothetical protein
MQEICCALRMGGGAKIARLSFFKTFSQLWI